MNTDQMRKLQPTRHLHGKDWFVPQRDYMELHDKATEAADEIDALRARVEEQEWQPIDIKPTECGWYLVWRANADCHADAYYDTDKGWIGGLLNGVTHWIPIKPPATTAGSEEC